MKPEELTISHAQKHQPWNVPYSSEVTKASIRDIPHILASHTVLHAAKTVGKLASIFEKLDHNGTHISIDDVLDVGNMIADLITEALRFGNLYGIDVARVLVERVEEKNGVNILNIDKG